ncbi:N-(5'-phosphoribosyl)anthranilate isomerase [Emticicia sp. BO119]|uniref:phosphoribosylanthranilate isomerase n=1 Tax=Emticicia sp. BO119 TaxID=2757768 RepID=UPI0015F044EF|nr:N-(5'-phosphoribosyl)anthranilate isomerase [Emticicia sp. BO119]MBA4849867.1 N-(5'-phosphoribosyl)anthranilate isomerase [Emticicia sp. BO119]
MALQTLVKVGNITNLSDARYCAGMGVELVGFVMDKFSNDFMPAEKLKEIKSWLAGVQIVGETQSSDYEEIAAHLQTYEVDILQISDPALLPKITSLGKPIILKLESDSAYIEDYLKLYNSFVSYFLIEGDELTDFVLYHLKEYAFDNPVILGFGITADNIEKILSETQIKGIALKGSHELRPGYKDYDELSEIFELLEVD